MNRCRFLILLLVAPFFLFGNTNKKKESDLGYYENLAVMSFVFSSSIFDGLNEVEKQYFSREIAFMAFAYFLDTRLGEVPISEKVDNAIRKIYRHDYKTLEFSKISNPFQDPLMWMSSEEPQMPMSDQFPVLSREEYDALLKNFASFLQSRDDTDKDNQE